MLKCRNVARWIKINKVAKVAPLSWHDKIQTTNNIFEGFIPYFHSERTCVVILNCFLYLIQGRLDKKVSTPPSLLFFYSGLAVEAQKYSRLWFVFYCQTIFWHFPVKHCRLLLLFELKLIVENYVLLWMICLRRIWAALILKIASRSPVNRQ